MKKTVSSNWRGEEEESLEGGWKKGYICFSWKKITSKCQTILCLSFILFFFFFRPRSVYRPLNPLAPSRGGFFIYFHTFRNCLQNALVTKRYTAKFSCGSAC